jgi:hypothetical protein
MAVGCGTRCPRTTPDRPPGGQEVVVTPEKVREIQEPEALAAAGSCARCRGASTVLRVPQAPAPGRSPRRRGEVAGVSRGLGQGRRAWPVALGCRCRVRRAQRVLVHRGGHDRSDHGGADADVERLGDGCAERPARALRLRVDAAEAASGQPSRSDRGLFVTDASRQRG